MSRLKGWVILTRKLVGGFARKLTTHPLQFAKVGDAAQAANGI
jgi:hypothetical protein